MAATGRLVRSVQATVTFSQSTQLDLTEVNPAGMLNQASQHERGVEYSGKRSRRDSPVQYDVVVSLVSGQFVGRSHSGDGQQRL